MAPENGRRAPRLIDVLRREPYRFGPFQAIRLLETWLARRAAKAERPRRGSVGGDDAPELEPAFFRSHTSLGFPSAAIEASKPSAEDRARAEQPLEIAVNFIGLTGPLGVLPRHYTSLLLKRIRLKDFSLRDFLDLFNHRIAALFFRAWEKYRLPFTYERSRREGLPKDADLPTQALYCLVGLGTRGLRGRLEVEDGAFLYYAGHFAHYPRSASALEGILGDYFGMPVAVRQLQGQWLALDHTEQTKMPSQLLPRGLNTRLGVNAIVGERVWDVQSKFRVRVGPLRYAQFRALMPNGDALVPFCELTRAYAGATLDFDVQPVLLPEEVPWCKLEEGTGVGAFLGWNTWVRSQAFTSAVDDITFSVTSL
jgi:type VI secretion system protein ImpH